MPKKNDSKKEITLDRIFETTLESVKTTRSSAIEFGPIARGEAGNSFKGVAGENLKLLPIARETH